MAEQTVRIGAIFDSLSRPRAQWRVISLSEETVALERVDKPGINRFLEIEELLDRHHYVPAQRH